MTAEEQERWVDPQTDGRKCEFCGAADPRYIRWLDRNVGDYLRRTRMGGIGKTAYALYFCEECEDRAEQEYPSGNAAALERIEKNIGSRDLDADDNEVRLLALMIDLEP